MNLNDWNDEYNQLSSVTGSMNFDDNEAPRLSINRESENQKLGARDDLGVGIQANDVLCGRGKTSFNHGTWNGMVTWDEGIAAKAFLTLHLFVFFPS